MRLNDRFGIAALALLAAVALLAAGCGKDEGKGDQAKGDPKKGKQLEKKDADGDSRGANAKGKDEKGKHEGWWCEEHGVPEELCSLCMSEADAKAKFKDKGDWCKLHDRAQSQCFKCDPKLYARYEAMYVAKFNEKPRRPPEEEFKN
jgi:hypothetical protein